MTIPVVVPFAGQRMIAITRLQWQIFCKNGQRRNQVGIEDGPMLTLLLSFIIPFELSGSFNRPYSDHP